jgi:hypothetical protein
MSADSERIARETAEIVEILKVSIREDAIPDWMEQPNDAFGGRTPNQVIADGETEQLRRAAYRLNSGEPGS